MLDLRYLAFLFLIVTLAHGDGSCDQDGIDGADIVKNIKRTCQNVLPNMVCDGFSRSYYGDRIPWARLESFSIAEGLDKIELRRTAHELHDRFLARVEMQSMEPIEPFKFRQVFRPPENVNNLWVSEVALASVYYVFGADQLNIFLNGGIIKEEGGEVWHYRDKKELEVVRGLSKLYEEAQGYINDTLKQRDHMKKAVVMFLEFEADKAAGCFYDQLAQSKATLHRTFVETVPKEKFVGFTKKMAQEFTLICRN